MQRMCANCGREVTLPPSKVAKGNTYCSRDCYRAYRKQHQQSDDDILARLLANRHIDERTHCWEWTGLLRRNGYGSINVLGAMQSTHRVAYELLRRPLAEREVIDHLCRNRKCFNPEHLEPVDAATNVRRGARMGSRKMHCPHGHPYTAENTVIEGEGIRRCRICRQEGNLRYKRNRRK